MDIKEILNKEFDNELNSYKTNKSIIPNSKSLSIDTFLDKYNSYKKDISSKRALYEKKKKESIQLYESRLNSEELFARKDKIYNESKIKLDNNDLFGAYCGFESIKGHKDSESLFELCKEKLDEKYFEAKVLMNRQLFEDAMVILKEIDGYKDSKELIEKCESGAIVSGKKEKIYLSANDSFSSGAYYDAFMSFESIIDYKDSQYLYEKTKKVLDEKYDEAMSLYNNRQYKDAIEVFKSLVAYKSTIEMIRRCETGINEQARIDKENAIKAAEEAKKKRKKKILFISLGSVAGVVALILILIFAVIIPISNNNANKEKYNNAISLINSSDYQKAITELEKLDYADSSNQLNVAKAGLYFKDGNIEDGIKQLSSVGGTTNVSYNANGGSVSITNETITSNPNISNIGVKQDYSFKKWSITNYNLKTGMNSYICDLNLIATYEPINYKITYVLNGGTNDSSNVDYYNVETGNISLKSPTKEGSSFDGWYCDGEKINAIIFETKKDVSVEARWILNQYKISLNNSASGVVISGVNSGSKYDFDSKITLTASNVPAGYSIKWVRSDGVTHFGSEYEINVPSHDLTIQCVSLQFERSGNKIYFGTYPQSLVTDETITGELNSMSVNWTAYDYYYSSNRSNYMYYTDVDYDNDGDYDYRGVYFTQYRPDSTDGSSNYPYYSSPYANGYYRNNYYWFKYERIEWDVLEESNGKILIISNSIIDSQQFYYKWSSASHNHNGGTGYSNEYSLSDIRIWLNNSFYNCAFSTSQKGLIKSTNIDGLNDSLFLMSKDEVGKYLNINTSTGSDYAKCQGLKVQNNRSGWILRTAYSYTGSEYYIYGVNYDGTYFDLAVDKSCYGIRPVCYISLE